MALANATIIIEQASDRENRIRKALTVPEDAVHFVKDPGTLISDRDCNRFLDLLDNPLAANSTLKRAARRTRGGDRDGPS